MERKILRSDRHASIRNQLLTTVLCIITLLGTSTTLAAQAVTDAPAEASLATIVGFINKTLNTYVTDMSALVASLMAPADDANSSSLQSNFTSLDTALMNNTTAQLTLQQPLQTAIFNAVPLPSSKTPPPPITPATLQNANDLSYSTLLNSLYFSPDPRAQTKPAPDPALNYIKNAAGITLIHTVPGYNLNGMYPDIVTYTNYYNTVTAVESYNAYILSWLYADYKSNNAVANQQNAMMTLMTQANKPTWFATIASENLGIVLRQMLMYQSQLYVIMGQLLDTQKKMLAAQAMTNSLLIANNQVNEKILLKYAANPTPK